MAMQITVVRAFAGALARHKIGVRNVIHLTDLSGKLKCREIPCWHNTCVYNTLVLSFGQAVPRAPQIGVAQWKTGDL